MSCPACWESSWLYVHQDPQMSSLLEPLAGEMTEHSHQPQPDIPELRRPARAQGPSPGRPSLFAGSIFLSGWQNTCALPLGPASTGHTPLTLPPRASSSGQHTLTHALQIVLLNLLRLFYDDSMSGPITSLQKIF